MSRKSQKESPSSMTGFARSNATIDDALFEVIVRSVNHRFLDIALKVPREIIDFESSFRTMIQDKMKRGRVELLVHIKSKISENEPLGINRKKIEKIVKEYSAITKELGVKNGDPAPLIMHLLLKENGSSSPDKVISYNQAELTNLVEDAIGKLLSEREKEGKALVAFIGSSLLELSKTIEKISKLSGRGASQIRSKLLAKLKSLKAEAGLDSGRLTTECALLAEKLDIAEEISRVRAHLKACEPLLKMSGQGKRLEFFAQELHREFTTLSGKSQDAEIQALAVAGRVEVEKIREQAQNLE